jgi:hypothetical protein
VIYIRFSTALCLLGQSFMLELLLMSYQPGTPRALPGLRARNTRTQALIRRDVIWQIAVPLGLAILGVAVLAVLLILPGGAPYRSVWADISLILLIIPTALFAVIALAVLGGSVYGLRIGLRELPFLFKRMQDWTALFSYRATSATEKVANVVLTTRSAWAGARKAAADIRKIFR